MHGKLPYLKVESELNNPLRGVNAARNVLAEGLKALASKEHEVRVTGQPGEEVLEAGV